MQPAIMDASWSDLQNLEKFAARYTAGGSNISTTLSFTLNQHTRGNPIKLREDTPWILVGGRDSIRQALAAAANVSFVASTPGNKIYVEYLRTESHKGLAAYASTLMAGQFVAAPFMHASTAMGRLNRNGANPVSDYGSLMQQTYSPGTVGRTGRAISHLAKSITVVALYATTHPINPTRPALDLGSDTTAGGLAVQLAMLWHI